MKQFIIIILAVLLFGVSCSGSKNSIGLMRILSMNQVEFNEIRKISIEDEKGFKYIKHKLEKNKFSSITTTTETQIITNEEHKKIKAILKKY
jgi:hypothetical protein